MRRTRRAPPQDGEWSREDDGLMVMRKGREVVTVRETEDGWIVVMHRPGNVYRMREPMKCSRSSALDQAEWLLGATLVPDQWVSL